MLSRPPLDISRNTKFDASFTNILLWSEAY